jgi:HPt (histidine-containing phosphotransfer) domain-containing protein
VHDEQRSRRPGTRGLPPEARAGLRRAYASELAERLPRLQAAVRSGQESLLREAVRDAHSLGSSAAVMGEPGASRAARAAEALLVGRPVDAPACEELRRHVEALGEHLALWRP